MSERKIIRKPPPEKLCKNCLGKGFNLYNFCPEGHGTPLIEDLREPIVGRVLIRSEFLQQCRVCGQFEGSFEAAHYHFLQHQIIKCGCGKLHTVVNPTYLRELPPEVVHTYSVTIKLVVDMHPGKLIQDKDKMKSALLRLAADRIEVGNYDAQDVTKYKLIEERLVE